MIPRVIHQTWKDQDVPARFLDAQRSWQDAHPDWEYRFWTDEDLAALEHAGRRLAGIILGRALYEGTVDLAAAVAAMAGSAG